LFVYHGMDGIGKPTIGGPRDLRGRSASPLSYLAYRNEILACRRVRIFTGLSIPDPLSGILLRYKALPYRRM